MVWIVSINHNYDKDFSTLLYNNEDSALRYACKYIQEEVKGAWSGPDNWSKTQKYYAEEINYLISKKNYYKAIAIWNDYQVNEFDYEERDIVRVFSREIKSDNPDIIIYPDSYYI